MSSYRMNFGSQNGTAGDLLRWFTDTGGLLEEPQARMIDERTIEFDQEAIDLLSEIDDDNDGAVGYEDGQLVMWVGGVSYPLTGVDD